MTETVQTPQAAAREARRAGSNNLGSVLAYLRPYVAATGDGELLMLYARIAETQRAFVARAAKVAEDGG